MTIVVYFDTKVFAYLIPVSLQLPNIQGAHFPHGSNKSHLLAIQTGVTALKRAVSGEKQIYSGNLAILPGMGKPGKCFGKYEIFSGH